MAIITCPRCSRSAQGSNYNFNAAGTMKQVCQFCAVDLADQRASTEARGGNYSSKDVGVPNIGTNWVPSP